MSEKKNINDQHFIKKEDDKTMKPKRYMKKPVVIEAMRFVGEASETQQVLDWLADNLYPMLVGDYTDPENLRYHDQDGNRHWLLIVVDSEDGHICMSDEKDFSKPDKGVYIDPASGDLMIRTLEGDMRARYGDYIIKGIRGEFYPCNADIFNSTYSFVEED